MSEDNRCPTCGQASPPEQPTFGQRAAERMAALIGSWTFLIVQTLILLGWISVNTIQFVFRPFDPFPYILLNLTLSFQAAYTGPILLIAANRQEERDRRTLEHAYDETRLLEALLKENTRLTQVVEASLKQNTNATQAVEHLTRDLHETVVGPSDVEPA